jgi:hypothetical protein
MTVLGLWTPFINEREMLSWYKLPAEMAKEARRYRPDGHEMDALSSHAYSVLHQRTITFVRQSVAPFQPAYHNDDVHFAVTEALGLDAADAYANGDTQKMPPLVRQGFGLALRTHDAHHCASTFRAKAPRGVYRPKLGTKVSSEWVTTQAVNEFMRRQGLNLPTRLFQAYVILSSTYGGQTEMGERLKIPTPQPQTIWGAIMRAADACPPESFGQWVRQGIAIDYGEVPALPAPRTLAGYVSRLSNFTNYIELCFDRLDKRAGSGSRLTYRLGWRGRLQTVRRGVDQLAAGDSKISKAVQAEVRKYGTTLD